MNRQITGTLAILAMLTVATSVPAQLPTSYGQMAMPAPPQMMPPQMMPPQMMPPQMAPAPAGYGQLPAQAAMQQAMIQQAMMRQAMAQQMMAGPAPMSGRPIHPVMMGAPGSVQPASHAACDNCDSSDCDTSCCSTSGCNGCGNSSLLGGLQAALNGGNLFGNGNACSNGACGLGSLFGGCNSCGIAGCDQFCSGAGGCCLPRWFDAHAEWMYWTRDTSESLALSSRGVGGPIVLNTGNLDYEHSSGYRVTGAYLVGPSTGIEATYYGGFNWQNSLTRNSPNQQLYSVFSDFGRTPQCGYPETGQGFQHSVAMSSDLNNGEVNVRRRFVGANCHAHSSLLVGVRYFRLREDLVYNTLTNIPSNDYMDYQIKTDNDLVGVQTGGDFYICLTPRFKIGAEAKAGVYGTHSKQRTRIFTSSPPRFESRGVSDVAFLGDAAAVLLYRVTPRMTLRGGYQILYVDGVATGVNNFNTADPFVTRSVFINNDGEFFAHGANVGFEWTW